MIVVGRQNGVDGGESLEMVVKFPSVLIESDEIGLIVEGVHA